MKFRDHFDQADHSDHMHASYQAVSFVTDNPIDPRRLVSLIDERPVGTYRIKGFVHVGVTGYRQRFGLHAVGAVHDGDFGTMMALRGTDIVRVPLIEGTGELKLVQPEEYAEAEVFFG